MCLYNNDMYCECDEEKMDVMPQYPRLATAYVPFQHAKCLYSAEKGLSQGSIFPELVMPYESPFHDHCKCQSECNCCKEKKEGCS